jgi:D-alanine-D-alanine ligase
VAVVFGGRSGEHAVSCISGGSVLANLDPDEFDVSAIGITEKGGWVQLDPTRLAELTDRPLPVISGGPAVLLAADPTTAALMPTGPDAGQRAPLDVDVVFPVLHGPFGEDGTIQGLLELADLPYVGPGVLASAAAMDKEFTKKLLVAEGLPVGPYAVLRPRTRTLSVDERERLGLPVFVKPARAGSSLGVTRVVDWAALDPAVDDARRSDPKVLVEAAVVGREIECGVLEFPDGRVVASPPAEIHVSGHDFYDFEAKYLDGAASFDIPAVLPDEVTATVQRLAVEAFMALDAQGLARVDFFVTDAGDVLINEVNTMPGFTPISMFPRMWTSTGMSYPDLLSILVRTALARGTGLR